MLRVSVCPRPRLLVSVRPAPASAMQHPALLCWLCCLATAAARPDYGYSNLVSAYSYSYPSYPSYPVYPAPSPQYQPSYPSYPSSYPSYSSSSWYSYPAQPSYQASYPAPSYQPQPVYDSIINGLPLSYASPAPSPSSPPPTQTSNYFITRARTPKSLEIVSTDTNDRPAWQGNNNFAFCFGHSRVCRSAE